MAQSWPQPFCTSAGGALHTVSLAWQRLEQSDDEITGELPPDDDDDDALAPLEVPLFVDDDEHANARSERATTEAASLSMGGKIADQLRDATLARTASSTSSTHASTCERRERNERTHTLTR